MENKENTGFGSFYMAAGMLDAMFVRINELEKKVALLESKNCETKQPDVKAEDCVAKKKRANRCVRFKRGVDVLFEGKERFEVFHNIKHILEKISKNKIKALGGNSHYYKDCQGQLRYLFKRFNAISVEYGSGVKIVAIRRKDVDGKVYKFTFEDFGEKQS